jgi:hypothetical protein
MHTTRALGARPVAGLGLAVSGALALGLAAAAPAAAHQQASASVANGTLNVVGSNRGEALALRLAPGDSNTLQVDFGDDGSAENSFDRSTFTVIDVRLRSGSDHFRVDQVNGAFADEAITVDAGSGDDSMLGGDGNEVFLGGGGRDSADGNRGADIGDMGSGSDTFTWDPGDGSDVVEGRSGFDTLDFNGAPGAEQMSLSAEGERAIFFRVQGSIRMDMDGVERLDLDALAGVDDITINDMRGTKFRQADVDLSTAGDGGAPDAAADVVTVNGTTRADHIDVERYGPQVIVDGLRVTTQITGGELLDRLQVNGGDGNDDVDVDAAVLAVIGVAVDLGPGEA